MIHCEKVARICHEANRALCFASNDNSQVPWDDAPLWQKESARNGVYAIIDNPNITSEELHQKWVDEKAKNGWVYGEKKDADKKTHPCILPYSALPKEQRVKDAQFSAIVKAHISIYGVM